MNAEQAIAEAAVTKAMRAALPAGLYTTEWAPLLAQRFISECLKQVDAAAVVVGEDGRIGRLEAAEQIKLQTNNLDTVMYGHPIEPVYRVSWETES